MIFATIASSAQTLSLKDSSSKHFSLSQLKGSPVIRAIILPSTIIPANYYSTNLGFFCKKELRLEAATRVPVKFRLGSQQYNDWMEGKPNSGYIRP